MDRYCDVHLPTWFYPLRYLVVLAVLRADHDGGGRLSDWKIRRCIRGMVAKILPFIPALCSLVNWPDISLNQSFAENIPVGWLLSSALRMLIFCVFLLPISGISLGVRFVEGEMDDDSDRFCRYYPPAAFAEA